MIGLILLNPSTTTLTLPTPDFSSFPTLSTHEEVTDYKLKFLAFLEAKKKKPAAKKRKKNEEDNVSLEFAMEDVSEHLIPTHATLGMPLSCISPYIVSSSLPPSLHSSLSN